MKTVLLSSQLATDLLVLFGVILLGLVGFTTLIIYIVKRVKKSNNKG